jgi:DNA-binding transcriptional MerR regulator
VLVKEVMRRTGLSRMQLRYLETRGLLGHVVRSDERRIFSERQVQMLDLLARFRELGASLDEAAALANERLGGDSRVADARLDELLDRAISENERRARVTLELREIRRRRVPVASTTPA